MKHLAAYTSHIPVLLKVMGVSSGPVLEMGTGFGSTILLHYLCREMGRSLVSYDNKMNYIREVESFHGGFHEVKFVSNWDDADILKPWSVALIDHVPKTRRRVDVARLANYAEYIICHDSEVRSSHHYKYGEIYPLFKYRANYKNLMPHTVVLSNFHDLKGLL